MIQTAHIETLQQRHVDVDALIKKEETRPRADMTKLQELKRAKLFLKEKIEKLLNQKAA